MDSSEYSVAERLVYCLRELRRRVQAGTQDDTGICAQLGLSRCSKDMQEYREIKAALFYAFKAWPESTKGPGFPVPCPFGGSPSAAYFDHANTLWEGAYGDSRIALLEYCIRYFELDCEENENGE